MPVQTFFLYLVVILLTARLFAEVASRAGAPTVIGELLAGVVLGPSVLGYIQPLEVIRLLAEVGIILLLFDVGLSTDAQRLARAGLKSLVVATAGFVAPFTLGFGFAYAALGLPPMVSMFVGGTLTATSIGITLRVLTGLRRNNAPEGQIVLGATVLDDVLGVVLLALLFEFASGGGVNLANAGKVIMFIAVFFLLAPIAAKLISLIIRRYDEKSRIPGLIPTTLVSLVLLFAWLAHTVGAPELLGGFAAGLALSRRFFLPFGISLRHDPMFVERIEDQMRPIVQLFTPIFFVTVGLSLNLRQVDWGSPFIWLLFAGLSTAAVAGKLLGALMLRESWPARWIVGVAMIPRGEVGLIFADLGRIGGILNDEIFAALILVIAATTLFPPFVMKWIYSRYRETLADTPVAP